MNEQEKERLEREVTDKACICHDLAGCATAPLEIDPAATPAVCCGPNAAYFKQAATLKDMIDHIYGRARLQLDGSRPHMLLKELSLHIEKLREDLSRQNDAASDKTARTLTECRENLQQGIAHYRALAGRMAADKRRGFLARLDRLQGELSSLGAKRKVRG